MYLPGYKPKTQLIVSGEPSQTMWMLQHKRSKRFMFPYMYNTRQEMRDSYIYAAWQEYYKIVKVSLTINCGSNQYD